MKKEMNNTSTTSMRTMYPITNIALAKPTQKHIQIPKKGWMKPKENPYLYEK